MLLPAFVQKGQCGDSSGSDFSSHFGLFNIKAIIESNVRFFQRSCTLSPADAGRSDERRSSRSQQMRRGGKRHLRASRFIEAWCSQYISCRLRLCKVSACRRLLFVSLVRLMSLLLFRQCVVARDSGKCCWWRCYARNILTILRICYCRCDLSSTLSFLLFVRLPSLVIGSKMRWLSVLTHFSGFPTWFCFSFCVGACIVPCRGRCAS